MSERDTNNPRRGRLQLLILMLMPISVVLMATFVFYTRIGMPDGTRNKGELISPPLQFHSLSLTDATGKPFQLTEKKDLWAFVVMFPPRCDDYCKQQLWETRQTRVSLGKYQGNIRRVWLVAGGKPDEQTMIWLAKEHADLVVVYVDSVERDSWLQSAALPDGIVGSARFFLMDPRGFVMMYYTPTDTYKDVITDMKFLLKGVE